MTKLGRNLAVGAADVSLTSRNDDEDRDAGTGRLKNDGVVERGEIVFL